MLETGREGDAPHVATPFRVYRTPIKYLTQNIFTLIEEQRESLRGNNQLAPETRQAILDSLDNLEAKLVEADKYSNEPELQENEANEVSQSNKTTSWLREFGDALTKNAEETFAAENVAKSTLPTAIILSCGALGALVAGPVGFGSASVVGNLLTGQMKPGAAADKRSAMKSLLSERWCEDSVGNPGLYHFGVRGGLGSRIRDIFARHRRTSAMLRH